MCEYKDDIDRMCWSYSRLTTFENCKYEFYLNYIIHDDEQYPQEDNFYTEVGKYVHEILAMIFSGELPASKALKYYKKNFNKNVLHKVPQKTKNKIYKLCADYFENEDFNWLNNYEILGVEKEIRFNIDGYDFAGYIDLLLRDKRDGRIVVVDNKSSEYPLKRDGTVKAICKHSFNNYKKQMYMYSHAVHEIYGEFPKEITWNHFKDGGKLTTIPFSKEEYDDTLKWLRETIHTIEKEVDYPPKTSYFYCNTLCSFRSSCEYRKHGKEK